MHHFPFNCSSHYWMWMSLAMKHTFHSVWFSATASNSISLFTGDKSKIKRYISILWKILMIFHISICLLLTRILFHLHSSMVTARKQKKERKIERMIWDKNENHLQSMVGTFVMYHLHNNNKNKCKIKTGTKRKERNSIHWFSAHFLNRKTRS